MKTAIICNTPYQILNMLNLFFNCNEYGDADLYIINRFADANKIYEKLKDQRVFKNIYLLAPNKNNVPSKLKTIRNLLNANTHKEDYIFDDWSTIEQKYDYLFYGDLEPFARIIEKYNSSVKAYVYDDGECAYHGNALMDCKSRRIQYIEKIFHLGVCKSKIQGLYVNNRSISKSTISSNILQLPVFNDEFVEFAKGVFEFENSDQIKKHKYLLMDYPMERIKEYNGLDLYGFMAGLKGKECLLRYHPCSNKTTIENIDIDQLNNSWELECVDEITDKHVLIGYYSTSQLMPKIIADKEPYVIFTYKIMTTKEGEYRFAGFEEFINLVRENYRNKDKIYIPNNENEFINAIKEIEKKLST